MSDYNFLQQPYQQDAFINFLDNNLNFTQLLKPLTAKTEGAKELQRLGVITTADEKNIAVFAVKITPQTKLARNRVALRNLVLKDVTRNAGDGALAVYIDEHSGQWRLSFIAITPKFDAHDKLEIAETASKRYTYLLGEGAQTHTAEKRLRAINPQFTLTDIIAAFAVEPLNKEFYEKLFKWYENAQGEVKFPNDEDINNHIQISLIRLLTRLLFIWFIKEKGLVNTKLFDEAELKNILHWDKPSSFYKAILQNLFFATLNRPIEERSFFGKHSHFVTNVFRYHSKTQIPLFKIPDAQILPLFEKTPFLNGGLFECLDRELLKQEQSQYPKRIQKNGIRIDGFSSHPDNPLSVPNELFFNQDEKNLGLIDLLNQYQFTAEESTPVDIEVALDPELLGRVFENLLAIHNPETQKDARKATGSFYTPREIVSYMVDESLKQYLTQKITPSDNDLNSFQKRLNNLFFAADRLDEPSDNNITPAWTYENENEIQPIIAALSKIKILDPAVGSGAFPMGALQKITSLLTLLDPNNEGWKKQKLLELADELQSIENDIKTSNKIKDTEVKSMAKKQLEEKHDAMIKQFESQDHNYLRKLYLIEKCIYGVDIQIIAITIAKLRFFISLTIEQTTNDEAQENYGITPLPNLETKLIVANSLIGIEHIGGTIQTPQIQGTLKNPKIVSIENDLRTVRKKYFTAKTLDTKRKYKKQDKELRRQIADLLEKDGWGDDIAQKIADWDLYNQNACADWFDPKWMFGINDGFDIIIGNPPYIKEPKNNTAFKGLKGDVYYMGKMDIWYLFACRSIDRIKLFGSLCFIAQNNWTTSSGAKKLREKVLLDCQISQLIDFGDYKIFEKAGIQTMIMLFRKNNNQKEYAIDYRKLICDKDTEKSDILDILNKRPNKNIEYLSPYINNQDWKNKSIVFSKHETILDKISQKKNFTLNEKEVANGIHHHPDFLNDQGVFVLNNNEKRELNLTEKELKIIKPHYTTKELKKYYADPQNKYWVIYTSPKFKNQNEILPYPNIQKHLDQFSDVITSSNKPYGLHRMRKEYLFIGEKIMVTRKCTIPTFSYVDFESYVSAAFYVIKTNRINQKYLVGLLNSKLVTFWLKNKGKMQGNNYQVDKEPLLEIPLFKPSESKQKDIIDNVNNILTDKQQGKDTTALERQIDQMVYKLYELTDDEIAIIEKI